MTKSRHPPVVRCDVLVCAPFGKDAEILTEIVSSEGLGVTHCASLSELVRRFSDTTDFILLTEEALVSSSLLGLHESCENKILGPTYPSSCWPARG